MDPRGREPRRTGRRAPSYSVNDPVNRPVTYPVNHPVGYPLTKRVRNGESRPNSVWNSAGGCVLSVSCAQQPSEVDRRRADARHCEDVEHRLGDDPVAARGRVHAVEAEQPALQQRPVRSERKNRVSRSATSGPAGDRAPSCRARAAAEGSAREPPVRQPVEDACHVHQEPVPAGSTLPPGRGSAMVALYWSIAESMARACWWVRHRSLGRVEVLLRSTQGSV